MSDVDNWLEAIGLGEYAATFAEHKIDREVLPDLSEQDLKDLGLPLGHRKKLLRAVAALAEYTPAPTTPTRPAGPERRQLTVMFVDLVGSTALSGKLDPEDMGRVIRAYQECCAEVIKRWDGHVAKYMGDGVVVYFGWPRAHEDDAERAVRAGLDVTAAVGRLTGGGAPLAARVGIATGVVMVGDLIGEGASQEEAVVGETPNLAARLEALAEPGSVVVDPRCRQLIGGLFDYADLGEHDLKGFAEPVQAWRVLGESGAESRFEALHGQQLTGLVGREHEIGLLADRWERAQEGEGQVVLLSGEPGIGKSRIVRALRERLADQPHVPLSHYCSPYHTNSALYPVIGLLERAASFARDEGTEARLDKLEALLARGTEALGEVVPLVAALLEIETGERYPPLALTPQRQKQRTLEVLVDQVEGLAAKQPVLAVYEDVHWVDPTTLEVLGLLIERVQHLPILMLITFRPEFDPPWTGHAHIMQLSLSRLTRRHGQALVAEVTGGKTLPDDVLEQIVARTDGVPLFVEELTKTVLKSGLLTDAGDHYDLTAPLTSLAIPATLHDSLLARLDRIPEVKETAQIASVIGREFSYDLLAAVPPLCGSNLDATLAQLVAAELIFRRGTSPKVTYTFKHALVQDAAYQSVLRAKRQQLHGHIAQALEERFPETAETEPELLAHHLTAAGEAERAVDYWSRAGRRALERSAYAETIAHVSAGLELLRSKAGSAERHRRELELQISRAQALLATQGWTAPKTGEAFSRARRLCRELGNPPLTFPVLRGLHNFHFVQAQYGIALEIGHECLDLAEKQDDGAAVILAHRLIGQALGMLGELSAGCQHLERTVALYDPQCHGASALVYGADSKVTALSHLSQLLWVAGHPDGACRAAEEALSDAERQEGKYDLILTLLNRLLTQLLRRDYQAVLHGADVISALAREHGVDAFVLHAENASSWARLAASKRGEDIDPFADSINASRANGVERMTPIQLGSLAEGLAANGRVEDALATIAEALEVTEHTGERWSEAELHRLKGEIVLRQAAPDADKEAKTCFRRSLDIARVQSAKSWELRTATSLAQLWRDQDKRAQARDLLAPVYGWFTEGFDTADLKDAKALLDELAS